MYCYYLVVQANCWPSLVWSDVQGPRFVNRIWCESDVREPRNVNRVWCESDVRGLRFVNRTWWGAAWEGQNLFTEFGVKRRAWATICLPSFAWSDVRRLRFVNRVWCEAAWESHDLLTEFGVKRRAIATICSPSLAWNWVRGLFSLTKFGVKRCGRVTICWTNLVWSGVRGPRLVNQNRREAASEAARKAYPRRVKGLWVGAWVVVGGGKSLFTPWIRM